MEDTGQEKHHTKTGANTPLTPPPSDPTLKTVHESFQKQIDGDIDISFPTPGPALEAKALFASDSQKSNVLPGESDTQVSQETVSKRRISLPPKYDRHAFDTTIESLYLKTFRSDSVPTKVNLEEGGIESGEEMVRRAKEFLRFSIPGGYPELARYTATTRFTCLREPWYWTRKYAYYGTLEGYTSGTEEIYAAFEEEARKPKHIPFRVARRREGYEHDFQRRDRVERDQKAQEVRQRMQVSRFLNKESSVQQKRAEQTTIIATTPRTIDHVERQSPLTPVSMPRLKVPTVPTRTNGKRKSTIASEKDADYDDDDERFKRRRTSSSSVQSKASKTKAVGKGSRHTWDINDNNYRASGSERFCKFIKLFLNDRSDDKENWKPFQDAIVPSNNTSLAPYEDDRSIPTGRAPDTYGDGRDLQAAERNLCHRLHIKYDEYRCQKNRLFLGLALMVEQNARMLADNPTAAMWNVGPAQAQLYGSMDANKLSTLWRAFMSWNWVHDMQEGNSKTKKGGSVSREYLDRFPLEYRTKLINEMIKWEDEVVTNQSNHIVQRI